MNTYIICETDLFCGELNYSYVSRTTLQAASVLGAVQRYSRLTGLNFRKQWADDYSSIYHSASRLTGLEIMEVDN